MGTVPFMRSTRGPWVVMASLAVLAVSAGVIAISRHSDRRVEPSTPAATPAAQMPGATGESGKVGDLAITEEAMQLAEIRIAPARRRAVAELLPVNGVVKAGGDRMVKVTPRIAGQVVSVSAVVGDAVRAGQVLASMESAELARAQADYRQAEWRVAVARNHLQRQRKLASLGVFGAPRMEEARKEVAASQGDVNLATHDASATETGVAEARSKRAALEAEVTSAEGEAASAESDITEAESQLGSLQAALTLAESRVRVAQSRFNRVDRLLNAGVSSRQQWEEAQAEVEKSAADVSAAKAGIAQGQAKVASARSHSKSARAKVLAAQALLRQAADAIETALARQKQAQARFESAGRRLEIAEQALAREREVFQGGHLTSKEIVEAEAGLRQAELDQQAAAQTVRLLGAEPGGGSRLPIVAPIAGRIQERTISPGESVNPEHPLFTILNLDLVWAQLSVTPADLPLVRAGQRVELTSDTAPGRTFTGTVSAIGSVADEKTRNVQVRCALVNQDGALRPETFVRGQIITDVRRERVVVPSGALQDHGGKLTVYVARSTPGAFEVRHVKTGAQGDGWREIVSGLRSGERVAVNGTFYLKSEALKSLLSDACCAVEKQ